MVRTLKKLRSNVFFQEVTSQPRDVRELYDLLAERTSVENISHTKMPTFEEHQRFVWNKPYLRWYFITTDMDGRVGTCYITREDNFKQHYIGIAIYKRSRQHGYGEAAVKLLLKECKELNINPVANINPANLKSIKLFKKLGFKELQISLKKEL